MKFAHGTVSLRHTFMKTCPRVCVRVINTHTLVCSCVQYKPEMCRKPAAFSVLFSLKSCLRYSSAAQGRARWCGWLHLAADRWSQCSRVEPPPNRWRIAASFKTLKSAEELQRGPQKTFSPSCLCQLGGFFSFRRVFGCVCV